MCRSSMADLGVFSGFDWMDGKCQSCHNYVIKPSSKLQESCFNRSIRDGVGCRCPIFIIIIIIFLTVCLLLLLKVAHIGSLCLAHLYIA